MLIKFNECEVHTLFHLYTSSAKYFTLKRAESEMKAFIHMSERVLTAAYCHPRWRI